MPILALRRQEAHPLLALNVFATIDRHGIKTVIR
jgi:hypothetical protein